MTYFSIVVSNATRTAYLIDTHGSNASHIIALTEFVTNLIAYGTTFFANRVVLSAGLKRTLLVVAAVQAACCLTCVPMYVLGKRVRSFVSTAIFCHASRPLSTPRRLRAIPVSSGETSRRPLVATQTNLRRSLARPRPLRGRGLILRRSFERAAYMLRWALPNGFLSRGCFLNIGDPHNRTD